MPDHDQNDWLASYFADLNEESRKQLAAAADLISRFTVMT